MERNKDSSGREQEASSEVRERNRAAESESAEPGERTGETAKDINVVRGDDRPQTARHSG